jgi:hypothetical protein
VSESSSTLRPPPLKTDQRAAMVDKQFEFMTTQSMDMQKRFGETYTIHDGPDDMQKCIDRLQESVTDCSFAPIPLTPLNPKA